MSQSTTHHHSIRNVAELDEYLREHTEVSEIIFSGSDPLTFPVGFLSSMVHEFSNIDHIKLWRFHSRVPAVDPGAVSAEWIVQLRTLNVKMDKQVVVVIHTIMKPPRSKDIVSARSIRLKMTACLERVGSHQ